MAASERARVAALAAAFLASGSTAGCAPSISSYLVATSEPPNPGPVYVVPDGAPIPAGFHALAVLSGDAPWSAFGNTPMLGGFIAEAQRRGCTIIVGFEDGHILTGRQRARRGEALCGTNDR